MGAIVAGVVALVMLPGGCNKAESAPVSTVPRSPVSVSVQRVKLQPVQRTVDVVGTLRGNEEAVISAKVPGRIAAIYKDVGDRVEANEVLAQIEKRDYELAVSQKSLAMLEALAKLGLKDLPGADFDLSRVPTVQRAKLQVENAEAKLSRGRQLYDKKPSSLLSDQDFADLTTAAAVAWKNHEVELLTAQTSLAEAKARKADLEAAQQRLIDTTVHTPAPAGPATLPAGGAGAQRKAVSYVIAERLVAVGEYMMEGIPLFRMLEDDPVKLRALAPEKHAAEIEVGQKVRVAVEAYAEEFWGHVSRVNPQVDPANRTFQLEALIPNPRHLLKSGGFARASVQTRMAPNIVFAPVGAVASFAGVSKVYVVRDGKAVAIAVETGARVGDDVEIVKGLSGNESVIVSSLNKLANGVPVVVSE